MEDFQTYVRLVIQTSDPGCRDEARGVGTQGMVEE